MKIVTVLGARPQFIKAGSVSRAIRTYNERAAEPLHEVIVHTGQHYDANMSDVFFTEMSIPAPDYFLGIGGKSHGSMTGGMIEKIEEVLLKEKPDAVLVYGDTNSTLAGALAASKLHIPIAHVESGLRSFNTLMPEEINRILTDRVSSILFTPTDTAQTQLGKEGFPFTITSMRNGTARDALQRIVPVGDVMLDGALFYRTQSRKPDVALQDGFCLCTIHRAENTDDITRLRSICSALTELAKSRQVVLPLHPRTAKILSANEIDVSSLTIIDPVGYLEMVWLIDHCSLVLTDSGGLQKEAFFFRKPCVTMRDQTEWVELVEIGANRLAGADYGCIVASAAAEYPSDVFDKELYGDGNASGKIVHELVAFLKG